MVRELKVTYIKLNGKSSLLFSAALSLPLLDMASGNRFEVGSVLTVVASAISWVVGAIVESGAAQVVKGNVHLAEYLTTKMCVYSRCYHTVLFHSTQIHSSSNSYLNLTIMQCCEDLLKSTEMKGNWLNPVPVTVHSVHPGVAFCTNTV